MIGRFRRWVFCLGVGVLRCAYGPEPQCVPADGLMAYDVGRFGAVAGDAGSDAAAIQRAIDCARTSARRGVYFPAGTYLLDQPLRAEVDGLTLFGTSESVLVLEPDVAIVNRLPEAILVHRAADLRMPPEPTRGVTIRNLAFDVRNGSDESVSYGVLQLNNCQSCVVQDVRIFWGGRQDPRQKPRNVDGVVFSQGSSGVIARTVVDGIPKAGIYIAEGAHDVRVQQCEVLRTGGPEERFGGTGIQVSGATDVTVSDCRSHDNAISGLFVGTNGPIGEAAPVPAAHVHVSRGHYFANGHDGILVASAYAAAVPHHIRIDGVEASLNGDAGLAMSGAEDVQVSDALLHHNGAQGLLIQTPKWTGSGRKTERILVSSPLVFDNGCCTHPEDPGIHLNTVANVRLEGGRAYATGRSAAVCTRDLQPPVVACTQNIAVRLTRISEELSNDDVQIVDLDVSAGPPDVTIVSADADTTPVHGQYRLQGRGAPAFLAPEGSQYFDLSRGIRYRRAGGAWVSP